ncbi:MAG: phosphodiester glycosidase family protein [Candidatus Saganbacteria bacterium]|nr:phosphodiester glycosidase family protein [Candidatus Saganbacteria bacterium]
MKKLAALFLLLGLLAASATATTLYRVRFGHYPDKIRTVFDFDGGFTYESDESKDKIVLRLKKTEASPDIQNYVELNDLVIRYLEIQREGSDLIVTIPLAEPVEYNIFYLNDPPRLVVDFGREYLNILSGGTISDGVEYLKVKKGLQDGRVNASVLRVDLSKVQVKPALAPKDQPNIIESFVNLINPWSQRSAPRHFNLNYVSNIVKASDGVAGINGTYFAYNGRPLGALMIDEELLSYSIYDRTAFFLDENNRPYIDNIFISGHFRIANGVRYEITGINQNRDGKDVIMYTSAWGEKTGTAKNGFELVVSKGRVIQLGLGDSTIPADGYVLSASGPGIEVLAENVKVGENIDTRIKVVPYSTSPKRILQLVSGGPRLVKNGRIYVSKHEERFKTDIAKGRAARTAVGLNKEAQLLLVTVDGPPLRGRRPDVKPTQDSIGMTLEELSELMLNLGADDAMNLDGGSSTTMVIEEKVVNQPTTGHERKVSNALVILPAP